ncbi:MAG TPA: alpha-xylosidase [Spirochaeta sp.]|nr:alpha-xylosidase [Spirochaeta sp.]
MKFSHGNWFLEKDFELSIPYQVADYTFTDNKLICYTSIKKIQSRSDTINGPILTYEFSSPLKNIIRLKIYHYEGSMPFKNGFEISDANFSGVEFTDGDESMIFSSGNTAVVIKKNGQFSYTFSYNNKLLTESSPKSSCYAVNQKTGESHIREQLKLGIGEHIYGLGERFTSFVKNSQVVDMWNDDAGTNSDLAYKNIPFYITDRNYGVFVNNSGRVSFEIGTQHVEKVQFSVPYEGIEYYLVGGNSMKSVIEEYTELCGRPPMIPKWSFGLWLSTSFVTNYDENTVHSFIDGMKEHNIPLSVFHYDCFWMKEMEFCNFEWNSNVFPNPGKMIQELKSKGLKISVWINPYIAQKSPLFKEAVNKGYLIKKNDGTVYQRDEWQAGLGIVDFTNPEACIWFKDKLKPILDLGIDTFKTDFGERIPGKEEDVCFFNQADPDKMRNQYSFLYNKTVYELLVEEKGQNEAIVFARAATAGCQRFPLHWSGDCWSDFSAMAENLRAGLSLGLCGFGFWSHDIGGFESKSSEAVYMRWAAFGLLSSHSRLHGSTSYRVPWNYSEEAIKVVSQFSRLKNQLMPYLYYSAFQSHTSGLPVIRPMVMEFPQCRTSRNLDLQYMLGSSLLVAPVFNEEGLAQYFLPKGNWVSLLSNNIYEGNTWVEETHDYFSIPLLLKADTALVMGKNSDTPEYDYTKSITIVLFDIHDSHKERLQIVNSLDDKLNFINIKRDGTIITLTADDSIKDWNVLLLGNCSISSDASFSTHSDGKIDITPAGNKLEIKLI